MVERPFKGHSSVAPQRGNYFLPAGLGEFIAVVSCLQNALVGKLEGIFMRTSAGTSVSPADELSRFGS